MNIIKRLYNATRYSLSGIAAAWRHEQAFRLDVVAVIIAVIATFVVPIQPYERHMLILLAILLLVVELINTAIEAVVDRVSDEQHDLSKRAKDCGSAAVFLMVLINLLAWGFSLASL